MQHISDWEKNIRIKHYFYTSILNFKALLVRSQGHIVCLSYVGLMSTSYFCFLQICVGYPVISDSSFVQCLSKYLIFMLNVFMSKYLIFKNVFLEYKRKKKFLYGSRGLGYFSTSPVQQSRVNRLQTTAIVSGSLLNKNMQCSMISDKKLWDFFHTKHLCFFFYQRK